MLIPKMQYNQMFWTNVPNTFQIAPTNNPQVIGEGDVVSNVSPDGTVQYFFMPVSQWLPYTPNTTVKGNYNYFNTNVASWFVRSISNPLQSPVFSQQQHSSLNVPLTPICYNSEYNINLANTGFHLKFHNDKWSSTTDLYYFFPGSPQRDCIPRICNGREGVQVEMPVLKNTICHCHVICNKSCHCPTNSMKMEVQNCMSLEDVSKHDIKYESSNKHYKDKTHVHKKSNRTQISCDCEKTPTYSDTCDKSVSTFTDQNISCTPEVGRETQTILKNNSVTNTANSRKSKHICFKKDIDQEKWYPKSSFAKKAIKSESSNPIDSDCCSVATSESCLCNSETD